MNRKNEDNQALHDKLEKQIEEKRQEISKLRKKYNEVVLKDQALGNEVKCAYVVFRSMEGAARCRQVYSASLWSRFKLCCTCNRNYRKLLLHGNYLKVQRAVDPTLILWENLGYSLTQRRLLAAFISLITLLMVLVCVSVYVLGRWADKEI